MRNKIKRLFNSKAGNKIFHTIEDTILEHNMIDALRKGVLVGFSGGADSVFLLSFLLEYADRHSAFNIVPIHVNHGIRGDEALRDEMFSQEFCVAIGLHCLRESVNVPSLAKSTGKGIEEAAREARYSIFDSIISSRNDVFCIATAHNASDNLETVIFNILRGSGSKGASGISPVRNNIVRPLIDIPKDDIRSLLDEFDIPYVIDSTNLSDEYSRNYIRKNILPLLTKIVPEPEKSVRRLSKNLLSDDDYIQSVAEEFIGNEKYVKSTELSHLHPAVLYRVILMMVEPYGATVTEKHINEIIKLLSEGNFKISLPKGLTFVTERGISYISDSSDNGSIDYNFPVFQGENVFDDFSAKIYLNFTSFDKIFPIVHKKSIQVYISSAIIEGELFIRSKKDGDTIFYNGMTHKLKKLFNDRKIPLSIRPLIPILCDEKGIVWVPGFGVRDDKPDKNNGKSVPLYVTLVVSDDSVHKRFYTGDEFK